MLSKFKIKKEKDYKFLNKFLRENELGFQTNWFLNRLYECIKFDNQGFTTLLQLNLL